MTEAGCPINQSAVWKIENGDPPRRIVYDEALAFARVFEMSLVDLSVPPEIAANDEVRLLAREYDQVTDMIHKGYRRQTGLMREMHEIAAQFPEATGPLDELLERTSDEAEKIMRAMGVK